MTNRFMSIRYPSQANMFNNIHIEPSKVLDYWQKSLGNNGKTPYWIYTKTKKTGKEEKIKVPTEEAIKYYLQKKNYSQKDLDQAVKFFGAKAYDPIFLVEELLSDK